MRDLGVKNIKMLEISNVVSVLVLDIIRAERSNYKKSKRKVMEGTMRDELNNDYV